MYKTITIYEEDEHDRQLKLLLDEAKEQTKDESLYVQFCSMKEAVDSYDEYMQAVHPDRKRTKIRDGTDICLSTGTGTGTGKTFTALSIGDYYQKR